ncbi:multidrug effflux MFS transporter [Massilia sp. W12]|uniref:multidrug effflux MFS transporter n=1 Tax=Massilia sp. W12 TaxID=3126507 RepID=UPI0030CB1840
MSASSHSERASAPPFAILAFMLAALAMLGPFSVDTYLPAFELIGQSLRATPLQVQQTLSAYMFAFSLMVIWHGPLSDSYGRRRVILLSLAVFLLASIGCALAQNVQTLWCFRVLQGLSSGAGTVVGRAIIRDWHSGPQAERLMSLVTMIFSIAPAIAPIIGGLIISVTDWHMIFWLLTAYTLLLLLACWRWLPESHPQSDRIPFAPRPALASLRQVMGNVRFWQRAGPVALNFAGLFLYISSAPVIIQQHLNLSVHGYSWLFIPTVSGMFLGSLAANRMAGRLASTRQTAIGFSLLLSAAGMQLLWHLLQPPALPWSVLPLFFYSAGHSIITPPATMQVLDQFPHIRGAAAACQSFCLTMLCALVAGVVAPFLASDLRGLAAGQMSMVLLSVYLWRQGQQTGQKHRRK